MRLLQARSFLGQGIAALLSVLFANSTYAQLSHRPDALLHDGYEGAAAGPYTDADAARFLTQATFGPTLADIQHLRTVGYSAWLSEQFSAPASTEAPYLAWVAGLPAGQNSVYQQQRLEAWLINSVQTPDPSRGGAIPNDELRQRVAYALSEIFVVSDRNAALTYNAFALASYYDLLVRDAFGNYRQLLEDVTLHPAMATYLSMVGNRKPNPVDNIRPDENYAREVQQLFSVGLNQLNLDGSVKLSNGQPIPTYSQTTVRSFAHVFTGWNFAGCTSDSYDDCSPSNPEDAPWQQPMQAVEAYHDELGPEVDGLGHHYKQLLVYTGAALTNGQLPEGGTAQTDLTAALDNIFHHPNVGPFIGKLLIQRLITSNPSAAYVQRVAAVFNNNGSGVRGDLRAVVSAILLDPEARYGHWQNPDSFGKLREPLLKLTHLWRAMASHSSSGRFDLNADPAEQYGQAPLRSPTVFNFFKPNFQQPGEIRTAGLVSPEFQIATDTLAINGPNDMGWRIFYFYQGSDYSYVSDQSLLLDETRDLTLAATPSALIDRYNLLFMAGQMSPFMRQVLLTRLSAMTSGSDGANLNLHRIQQALYLIMMSPEYSVQK